MPNPGPAVGHVPMGGRGGCPEWFDRRWYRRRGPRRGVKSTISLKTNPGGRSDRVARLDVPYSAAAKLAELQYVVVEWTKYRFK